MNRSAIDEAAVQTLIDDLCRDYGDRADVTVVATTVSAAVDFSRALYLDGEADALDVLRIAVRHRLDAGLGSVGRRAPRLYGIRQRKRSDAPAAEEETDLYDAV